MPQTLATDFIKNQTIQLLLIIGVLLELAFDRSIKHSIILFGIPYSTSVVLHALMQPKKLAAKPRISAQYRK